MKFGKTKTDKTILNSILVIVGFIFNKAISFIMIPVLTRILTTSDYGKISTYAAWMALLAYIIGMALEYSVRNAYIDYKQDMERYMSALYGLSIVGASIIGVIIFSANHWFTHQMNDVLCICCILHVYVHALINYMNMKYTMYEQYIKRVSILVLPNLLSSIIGIVLIVLLKDNKYMGRIWGYIFVFIPLGIFILVSQIKKGKTFYDRSYWKYALVISLPMIAHGLSNVVLNNFDRILLSNLRNDSEAGIYSLVYNFSMIAIAFTTAIENIWIPWFTKNMEKGNYKAINKLVNVYIYVVVIIMCGILMVAPEVLMLMSAKEYWSGKIIIAPIVLSSFMIFLYSLHVAVEIYYKSSKYIAFNTFIAALLNIILDVILIPYFGVLGAAYTTLFSYMLSFLMHYRYSKKLNKDLYPFKTYVLPLLIVSIMTGISYLFLEKWIVRWGIAVVLGVIIIIAFINRNKIVNLLKEREV